MDGLGATGVDGYEVGVGGRPSNALSYAWEYLVALSQSYLQKSNAATERWP